MRRVVGALVVISIIAAIVAVVLNGLPFSSGGQAGVTWRWIATTGGDVAPVTVPDPERYTVEFGRDQTSRIRADCVTVPGTYQVTPAGRMGPLTSIVITPAPGDLPACGPGSLADAFIADLGRARSYRIADGLLTISLADGRRMTFR